MPRALLLLLVPLLLLAAHTGAAEVFVIADTANQTLAIADVLNDTISDANEALLSDTNSTLSEEDHEPIVRKKRTFGDIVFRGLADVLGYNVARKPPQAFEFPPPLAPVPGLDTPQAGPAPAPAAPPAPAPAAPPCARAAAPPPCRARQAPAQPKARPPCAKPRAAPRPKPARPPPPPPPPPCAAPRANPTTAAPCAPPKADNLETITSNLKINFDFNRAPVATPAPADEEEDAQQLLPIAPIAIQPRAARLPPPEPRNSRVYVDAFVVRDGVAQKVHTIDAQNLNRQPAADDDYLFDVEDEPQIQEQDLNDDYEDVQESRGQANAVREVGTAVNQFWAQKQKPKQKLPPNDYRNVHFGDRDLANQIRRRSDSQRQNNVHREQAKQTPISDYDDDSEVTTTTQDPRRKLKPRVLPPTEHNPNQIDTVTVRVPPIYKEKRPKKLNRDRPDRDEDLEESRYSEEQEDDSDSSIEQSAQITRTEAPKRRRRRKKSRRVRSLSEAYTAGDYDYHGKKLKISKEEEHYRGLTIPPPTKDADLARLEEADDEGDFLDDHERLREDPERIQVKKKKKPANVEAVEESRIIEDRELADESERSDDSERSAEDRERSGSQERADENERTDALSPSARVRESGYKSNYLRATNVQVDRPRRQISRAQSDNLTLKS
ncbi:unnamed protein product [Leptidea sinapis]|uniref:Uncharacterized protein n=1 Tax=Leptidea sinapis TaxID=189913 RepID=A0A5E4QN07_9NEOP|nr:unnamed protein product [Leptidea sinapis]